MKTDYPPDFEAFMSTYPNRPRNPKKLAFIAWKARLREGCTPELLAACAREYATEMRRKGKIGTEYVLMAATFLGPNERWAEYQPKAEKPAERLPAPPRLIPEKRIDGRAFIQEILRSISVKEMR